MAGPERRDNRRPDMRHGQRSDARTDTRTQNSTGRKPTRTIRVPAATRPHILPKDVKNLCLLWKRETDCEIVPYWDRLSLVSFDLFGTGTQADAAVRIINKWIESSHAKTAASSAWSKSPAFDFNAWYYGELSIAEAGRKQKFKNPPPEDVPFKAIVSWPHQLLNPDVNVTPREVFGNKLEQLDPIRIQDEVFITLLLSDPPWQVEISGYEPTHVEVGEEHYRNQIQKTINNLVFGKSTTNVILDETEGSQVVFQKAEAWWPTRNDVVPKLLTSLMDDAGGFRNNPPHPMQIAEIQDELQHVLEGIRFERGSYDLAIGFGCLCVSAGKEQLVLGEPVPLPSFARAIRGKISCAARKWLGQADFGEQLLERLMKSENILEPAKSIYCLSAASLPETRPTLRATHVVEDPTQRSRAQPMVHYVVQIDWTEDEDGMYERGAPRYYKLKEGSLSPEEKLDINMLELADSRAWHFGMNSMTLVAKSLVDPSLSAFADGITMRPGYSANSRDRFAKYTPGSAKVVYSRLAKTYTFGIKGTNYQLEAVASWFPAHNVPLWGLVVRHSEWATHLAPLETLPFGRGADWGEDIVKTFFPDNGGSYQDQTSDASSGNGIRVLLKHMMGISKVVNAPSPEQPVHRTLGSGLANIKLVDMD